MSSDDADDERESPLPTPVGEWIDPRSLKFTVFVVLPSEEVCTLRDLPSGISVFDLKGRLEIQAGTPSQLYYLTYPDGEELPDDQKLLVYETILDGYLLKMQIYDNWESLYVAVTRNNIEHVYHSGGVHLKGNIVISQDESGRYESMVRERGAVSLYLSCFLGLHRMVNMLLSVGVDANSTTLFGRTPLHAAVSRDNLAIAERLIVHGAVVRQTDCFGVTALELARELCSNVCAKKLRLMHLNLRGSATHFTSASGGGNGRTYPQLKGRDIDSQERSQTAFEMARTHSTLSQFSENSFSKHKSEIPIHKSRKHISASAPIKDTKAAHTSNRNFGNTDGVRIIQPKRAVKWKDAPSNAYWQVIQLPHKHNGAIQEAVNVKPIAVIQQRKILKFANQTSPDLTPTVPSSSPTHENDGTNLPMPQINTKAVRFTKSRMRYFKKLANSIDDNKTMRRKISIAANQGKSVSDRAKVSEAFKEWLVKKSEEIENEVENENSSDSDHSENEQEDKLKELNKRVRKLNKRQTRCLTPGNRPRNDIIRIGSTQLGDGNNPPVNLHITAHNDWLARQKRSRGKFPRRRTVNDFMAERKELEEKRQMLLMNAISYDEWMDHADDRKFLIKQILQADLTEMKRLEEERFKDRYKLHSFDGWKDNLKKREIEDKNRKEAQKKYEAEQLQHKMKFGTSSSAIPFDEWVKQKREIEEKEKAMKTTQTSTKSKRPDPSSIDSAYEKWLLRKHNDDMTVIESQIRKERELLGTLRQMRTAAATS